MNRYFLLLGLLAAFALGKDAKCNMHEDYPPTSNKIPSGENKTVEWFTLNLDAAPEDRWTGLVKARKDGIANLIGTVTALLKKIVGDEKFEHLISILDLFIDKEFEAWPNDYGREVDGISKATGIRKTELFILQMAYEVWGLCTSMVVQDSNGEIWHGRNLDFGLFPAFDFKNMEWKLTEALRPLVINVDVQRGGKTLYYSTSYAGFAGVITGMRKGAFSISVDTRFDNKFDMGLIKWILGDKSKAELTFTVRSVLEDPAMTSYSKAYSYLKNVTMIGPSYIIIGGMDKGEGAIISKDQETINVLDLNDQLQNGTFYVVETNYDNWKKAPFFDDRRNPAKACLDQMGSNGVNGFSGVFNTLNGKPNLNKLTTYTTLMSVKTGKYEAYRQYCEGWCAFW